MTTLLVCSGGGHLQQMWTLRPRLPIGDVTFVTFDTPQSRSLLAGEDVVYVPYAAPRDLAVAAKIGRTANDLLATGKYDRVVSTGASVVTVAGSTVVTLLRIPSPTIEMIRLWTSTRTMIVKVGSP